MNCHYAKLQGANLRQQGARQFIEVQRRNFQSAVHAVNDITIPEAPQRPIEATQQPTISASQQSRAVTVEYQRQAAKEMVKFFRNQLAEERNSKKLSLGFNYANEINNGRWVMLGLAIGLLTEYSTGVDFVDQIKLMLSYTGVIDLD